MAFTKTSATITVPNPAATGSVNVPLKWDYAEIVSFKALLTGTDTAVRIKITDANSRVVYLDAADRDYKTAAVEIVPSPDATLTGLSTTHVDATGAALTVGLGAVSQAVKSPITIDVINGGTAGDVVTIDLYTRGPVEKTSTTLTVPNPAATITGTMNLRSKYAQVIGLSALLTGTDTLVRLRVTDADSRIVFLDAADRDYKTAKIHLVPSLDDTLTGLSVTALDATGAAATATAGAPTPIVKSPLTLGVINGGTAADTVLMDVYYRMA